MELTILYRLVDWWREITLPRGHRRRIRSARRTLDKLSAWLAEGEDQAAARVFGYLRKIDPLAFEELTLEAFARAGIRAKRGRRYSGDGGVDGHVLLAGHWAPIQCKRYSAHIDPTHVEAFATLVAQSGALVGYFVHTGRTGPKSRQVMRGAQVEFVSGQRLIGLLSGEFPQSQHLRKGGNPAAMETKGV